MERDAQLIYTRRGTYAPVDKLDLILGRISGHRDGFGFLVPDDGSDDTTEDAILDVFEYIADALAAYRKNDRNEYDRVLREAAKAINTMLGESK